MVKSKKKKAPKSGFYYFMMEVRDDELARGRHYSMDELKEIADAPWQALSPEEKADYNQMAKADNAKSKADLENKFTSMGISFAELELNEREKEEERRFMLLSISNSVEGTTHQALVKKKFYVAHVNHYFVTDDKQYAPCEIALAEFSLMDGVKNTLHFIVEPGEPPLGMRGTAKTWAEKTHGINLSMSGEELQREKSLLKIYSNIRDFMEKEISACGEKRILPPIYSMIDSQTNNTSISAVVSCMKQLTRAANENSKLFRVFPITELFYALNAKFNQSKFLHSVAILTSMIEKDSFSNHGNLACGFHEEKDLSAHCSLSIVKRWVYGMCDLVCPKAEIELIPGKHVPEDAAVDWVVNAPKKTGKQPVDFNNGPSTSTSSRTEEKEKLRERRELEKEIVSEQLAQAQNFPPPRKAWGTPPPQLMKELEQDFNNFPPIGGGRGQPLPQIPTALWPLSSRGKIIRK